MAPRDLWQERVPAQWRERAPRVVDTADGPYWVCGEDRWDAWGGRTGAAGALGGRRSALARGGVLEPGVLRPTTTALRLEDMARDGIDATVMYGPIVPLLIKDPELRQVCYRAYNDWLAEFCATAPERLVGAGLIPIDEPKMAADEVRHLKDLGLRTGMLLAARVELPLGTRGGSRCGRPPPRRGCPSAFISAAGSARWWSGGHGSTTPATWVCASRARPFRWTSRWPA